MEFRRLGGSGTHVSEIALGNWITHGGQIGDDAAKRCVEAALDAGINFFDTADIYERGKAETVIGNCLKGIECSSYDEVVLAHERGPQRRRAVPQAHH